ncbi:hypothetical protein Q7C36_003563 [Tachysurus vachellii]|uniref:Uncharacterized protein n=1 Tax=Tachysurus vachellii TaxID=175792 RepID=A0AA88P424_TACVA|nr:hypothetical protein Q7C36_003563 [Tachysurus vachellii]
MLDESRFLLVYMDLLPVRKFSFSKRISKAWMMIYSTCPQAPSFIEAFSGNIVKVLGKANMLNKDMSFLINWENNGTRYGMNSKLGPEQREGSRRQCFHCYWKVKEKEDSKSEKNFGSNVSEPVPVTETCDMAHILKL